MQNLATFVPCTERARVLQARPKIIRPGMRRQSCTLRVMRVAPEEAWEHRGGGPMQAKRLYPPQPAGAACSQVERGACVRWHARARLSPVLDRRRHMG